MKSRWCDPGGWSWREIQGCTDLSGSFHQPQDRAGYGELFENMPHVVAARAPLWLVYSNAYTFDIFQYLQRTLLHNNIQQHTKTLASTETDLSSLSPRTLSTIVIESAHMDIVQTLYL